MPVIETRTMGVAVFFMCMFGETISLTPRSQSVGAAEGTLGDSGWGGVEATGRECPPS